jgi:hypothetical protein
MNTRVPVSCGLVTLLAAASCGVEAGDGPLFNEGANQLTEADVASSAQPLTKGNAGAVNGDKDYCGDPASPCGLGEGDCDSNAECTGGTICVPDNGSNFGFASTWDVCAPAHCANRALDGDETSVDCGGSCGACPTACVGAAGGKDFCEGCRCASGQGDCDATGDCQAGLVCAVDNGPKFGLPAGYDVCVPAHCANGVLDANSGETAVDFGGACGSQSENLNVAGTTNLARDSSMGRACADGGDAVSYSVTALTTNGATLATVPSDGCLAPGDELLVINLQGTATDFVNVGSYELLHVSAVAGNSVTFSTAKARFYGNGAADDTNIGTARTNQRVMLQRVPNYQNVSVSTGGVLTGDAWDGVKDGVLFLRATGTVKVGGSVSMSGKGYAGGSRTTTVNSTGMQGESIRGLGSRQSAPRDGGGGGGIGDGNGCQSYGVSGGGGGYGVVGNAGSSACSGLAGATYGDLTLVTKLLLGSGGGSGGTDNVLFDNPPGGFGGAGGGVLVILANQLRVSGAVVAGGDSGEGDRGNVSCNGGSITDCWDFSGPGGGGSGGSILLDVVSAALGANRVTALGGSGGDGNDSTAGNGGDGGSGRIAIRHQNAVTGSTIPAASSASP